MEWVKSLMAELQFSRPYFVYLVTEISFASIFRAIVVSRLKNYLDCLS